MSPTELDRLASLSARIGRNWFLTQGSSGNTSIKDNGYLWVKASGKWLSDAERHDVFVPVHLAQARRRVWTGTEIGVDCVAEGYRTLRPSIETAMHAVLPHRVVLHVHSVATIAAAVRADADTFFASQLNGLPWGFIPYVASGMPLAWAIRDLLARLPGTRVFVLGNHGLIVCGNGCDETDDLLAAVERRLSTSSRTAPPFQEQDLVNLACGSSYVLPTNECIHTLATDPVTRDILAAGVLYPCQAIFLGGSRPWRVYSFQASESFLIVPGKGVLIRRDICSGDYEALVGLAEVAQRIQPGAVLRYLTTDEALSAEGCTSYREAANKQPSARFA